MTLKFSFERLQSHKNGCQLEACSMYVDLRQKMPITKLGAHPANTKDTVCRRPKVVSNFWQISSWSKAYLLPIQSVFICVDVLLNTEQTNELYYFVQTIFNASDNEDIGGQAVAGNVIYLYLSARYQHFECNQFKHFICTELEVICAFIF